MGYNISAYLVDVNDVRKFFGSKDYGLVSKIESRFYIDISNLDEWVKEDWDEGTPSVIDVLLKYADGSFPWEYHRAPYKETLELICKQLGERLPNEYFTDLDPQSLIFLEEEDIDISKLVFGSGSPVSIPGMEDEKMYRVGHITPDTAAKMLVSRSHKVLDKTYEQDRGNWKQLASNQFQEWLELSIQFDKSIVTFFS